jgi:hypothetical protein
MHAVPLGILLRNAMEIPFNIKLNLVSDLYGPNQVSLAEYSGLSCL